MRISIMHLSDLQKYKLAAFLALHVCFLGALGGAAVWVFLRVLLLGMAFFWDILPRQLGAGSWYLPALCLSGGLAIGLFQRRFGILPDTMAEVMARVKRDGTYDYHRLPAICTAVLLPLFAGGSLGPEAGLTGIITSLCFAVRDRARQLVFRVRSLVKAGLLPGLASFFALPPEPQDDGAEKCTERLFSDDRTYRRVKACIYAAGLAGGVLAAAGLHHFAGGGAGLPQLVWQGRDGIGEWKWFPLFVFGGLLLGQIFLFFTKYTHVLAKPLADRRILSCLTAGLCVALLGSLNPENLFSGGGHLLQLAASWRSLPLYMLFATAVTKLLTTALCLAFGWKGGSIFPIVYSTVSLGYGLAALTGALPLFAVTATTAAACGYLAGKPLPAAAVMLLCFPVRALLPMLAAACAGAAVRKKMEA